MELALKFDEEYKVTIDVSQFIVKSLDCERYLKDNLNLPGFTKCHVTGRIIEIFFKPPRQITDEYVLQQIDLTLKEIGIIFVKAVIRHYVSNAVRTLVASAAGGVIAGVAGALAGALVEKVLFGWEDVCKCEHGDFGELIITSFGDESL